MPICKKCEKPFPNRVKIDGRERVLCNRKYCLECSPFGVHNTRPLELKSGEEIVCGCGRRYVYDHRKGHKKDKCNSCHANERRFALKQRAISYKGGKCKLCGYDKCSAALTFHHRNPDGKEFSLAGNHSLSWKRVKAELDKCDLLCMNCHAEEHERIRSSRSLTG